MEHVSGRGMDSLEWDVPPGAFPLSAAQQAVLAAQQLDPDVPISIAQYIDLRGPLDLDRLAESTKRAAREIGSGYLRLAEVDGRILQWVDETEDAILVVDFRDRPEPESAAREWMREEYATPIDPLRDRLALVAILRIDDVHSLWYCRIHHVALDGFGAMILIDRAAELYTAAATGAAITPARAVGLEQLYEEDEKYRSSARFDRDRRYWADRMVGLPEPTSLALRSALPSAWARIRSATLSREVTHSLSEVARAHETISAAVVIAALAAYLARVTGRRDVVVSIPVSGRTTAAGRRSGGMLSNVVPLRLRIDPQASLVEVLSAVRTATTEALRHQHYRHEDIRRAEGTVNGHRGFFGPLINIMLFHSGVRLGSVEGTLQVLSTGPVEDLSVNVYRASAEGDIRVDFAANPGRYTEAELHTHHQRFLAFLEIFCTVSPDTRMAEIDEAGARDWVARVHAADNLDWWVTAVSATSDEEWSVDGDRSSGPSAVSFTLEPTVYRDLLAAARVRHTSVFVLLHAALAGLLTRIGGTRTVSIGTPVRGYGSVSAGEFVDMYANELSLRTSVNPRRSLDDLITVVDTFDRDAFARADIQLETVAGAVSDRLGTGSQSLFRALLAFDEPAPAHPDFPGVMIGAPLGGRESVPDLTVRVSFPPGGIPESVTAIGMSIHWVGAESTAAALSERFVRMIAAIATSPDLPLGQVDLLGAEERRALTPVPARVRPTGNLADLFVSTAADRADATALVIGEERISYSELDRRSNRLARLLVTHGVGPEVLVGVMLPRSADLIVALLAVLKAGGGYLPLDSAYPSDRLGYMVDDAAPVCVVTDSGELASLPATGIEVVVLGEDNVERQLAQLSPEPLSDADRTARLRPDNIAYVIYTSGSTGLPKGVPVPHAAVVRLLENTRAQFGFGPNDVWTLFHSYAFDFSVWELWGALLHGGTLALVDYYTSRDPDAFRELVRREGVTVLNQTPSAFYQFIDADFRAGSTEMSLRYVIFGGEMLDLRRLRRWSWGHGDHGPLLVNMYGITETTVHVSHLGLSTESVLEGTGSPVGGPIPGLQIYLLDEFLQPVPVGVDGEIYVGGGQLARGYSGRGVLTATRFVANPFAEGGARLYRSGDRARWTALGSLEYVGRGDDQVKVRGFRIEPGEIDAVIMGAEGVNQSVTVVARTARAEILATYVTVTQSNSGTTVTAGELRRHAEAFLPAYMVPDSVMIVDAIPLTANGKLDRRALPAPSISVRAGFRAPGTEVEHVTARIIGEMLGVEDDNSTGIGLDDNFFHLGGNSLIATQLVARLSETTGTRIGLRDLFENPTVAELAAVVERAEVGGLGTARHPVPAGDRPETVPLAPAQQRLWFLNRLDSSSGAYNIPLAVTLRGLLDIDALRAALNDLVDRHESLRTVLPQHGDHARQVVRPVSEVLPSIEVQDLDSAEIGVRITEIASRGFDLTEELPIRAELLRVGTQEHILILVLHHVASDGWSLAPLAVDIETAYSARVARRRPQWAPLPVQYADYALWQQELLGRRDDPASVSHQQISYWQAQLAGIPDEIDLPTDRPRPNRPSMSGDSYSFGIDADIHRRLSEIAAESGATTFMAVHACLALLLARYSDTEDIVIGTPVAGRGDRVFDGLVGMFVNTLALRTEIDRAATFAQLLRHVREVDLAAFANADVPFEEVVDALGAERVPSRHPVFQVAITAGIADRYALTLPGLDAHVRGVDTGLTKFDLELTVAERRGDDGIAAGIDASFTYATELFDSAKIRSLATSFLTLLRSVVTEPECAVGDVRVLDEVDGVRLRPVRGVESIQPRTLGHLLEKTAWTRPDALALEGPEGTMTYGELDRRSNRLARYLRDLGVGAETYVALAVARSFDSVLAVWAVAKSGGAYVPVDPRYPADRVTHMLSDSGVVIGLRGNGFDVPETVSGRSVTWIDLQDRSVIAAVDGYPDAAIEDREREGSLRPENAAYVIYTSGSTGVPKGTVVTHSGLANLAMEQQQRYEITSSSRTLHFASPSFDGSVLELLLAGATGATMILAPSDTYGGSELSDLLRTRRVTHAFVTPAALATVDPGDLEDLAAVVVGGEACPPELVQKWAPRRRFHNGYGPTETTVMVCISDPLMPGDPITIGGPVRGVEALVLDKRLQAVPFGAVGELYLAGPGLARGYHARRALTSERFVANPYSSAGARMYRTGDIVRWTDELTLRYVGRSDHQVKVRGFRIELDEVDAALTAHPGIEFAVTLAQKRGAGTVLVSYVLPRGDAEVTEEDLSEFVALALPGYMLPASITFLDAIPLTPVGKLDRSALPEPVFTEDRRERRRARPGLERTVADIFGELLEIPEVGAEDGFFELGGNSLIATQLTARLLDATGHAVPVRAVFEHPTVEGVAQWISNASSDSESTRPLLRAYDRPDRLPLSPAQQRLWFVNQLDPESGAYNIPFAVRMRGALDIEALNAALSDVLARHEALRTVFVEDDRGPAQRVLPSEHARVELTPIEIGHDALDEEILRFSAQGFDLDTELPIRFRLFRPIHRDGDVAILMITVHHIAFDGWSLAPFARDLVVAYQARVEGRTPFEDALAVQYADYALWQRELLGDSADPVSLAATELEYWRSTLLDLPDRSGITTDRPRTSLADSSGDTVELRIGSDTHRLLEAVAAEGGFSSFMIVHAALAALLGRVTAASDIVIGTPVAGRGPRELDGLVGMFVNSVVLRTEVEFGLSFAEFVRQVRDVDLAAFAHATLPFERLVDEFNPDRSSGRHPLFQVMLSFHENMITRCVELPNLVMEAEPLDAGVARFDLELTLVAQVDSEGEPAGMTGTLRYATALFDRNTVQGLASRFERFLDSVIEDPSLTLAEVDILEPRERAALVPVSGSSWTRVRTLSEILTETAARSPEATAVVFEGTSLTYRQLSGQSAQLARVLIEDRGIGPEDVVAIALPRSLDSVVALWAVAATGAAFVPIDPHYPVERVRHMITDSGASHGLTAEAYADRLPGNLEWTVIDAPQVVARCAEMRADVVEDIERTSEVRVDNCAYIIYTSGSTGTPKGVEVTHRGLAAFDEEQRVRYGVLPTSRTLHFSSPSFDASVLEFLLAFGAGATMVIASPEIYGGRDLESLLEFERLTHAFITPAALASMDPSGLAALQTVIVGGEACPPQLVERWAPGRRLFNGYGPTETTIMVCISDDMTPGAPVTIGGPIREVGAVVLDARLQPTPVGVVGELYLTGPGLARGYRGLAGLTSSRFLAAPFGSPGTRMYRTGDLMYWTRTSSDAYELVYVGRSDHQVKIRGFRIELGEIDSVLVSHPMVEFAVTVGHTAPSGETVLVSYVLPKGSVALDVAALLDGAAETLPAYMVPSSITVLEAIPLTPVGKIDRRALPAPDLTTRVREYVPVSTETEAIVAEVFANLLGVGAEATSAIRAEATSGVGAEANFFEYGGNSLLATQAVSRIAAATDRSVGVRTLFEHPTVAALAAAIDEMDTGAADSVIIPVDRSGPLPLSFAQQRIWFINQLDTESAAYNVPFALSLIGEVDPDALAGAFTDMIARHEALRTVYPDSDSGPGQDILEAGSAVAPLLRVAIDPNAVEGYVAQFVRTGFDVTIDTPLRAALLTSAPDRHTLVVVLHHIAADGWSVAPLIRDLMIAYSARRDGAAPEWTPLSVQYADFAVWQRKKLGSLEDRTGTAGSQLAFWRAELAGLADELELPLDFPRPSVQSQIGNTLRFEISAEARKGLERVARARECSVFMTVHAAYAILLARMTGSEDIVVGTPVAGRGAQEIDELVGMFVNTVVLRTQVRAEATFSELLESVRRADIDAFANTDLPFEQLVDAFAPARSTSRHPLFQAMISYHTAQQDRWELPELEILAQEVDLGSAKFDLQLTVREYSDEARGLEVSITYASALFEESTIDTLGRRFTRIVDAIAADSSVIVGDIDILEPGDRRALEPIHGMSAGSQSTLAAILADAAWSGDQVAVVDVASGVEMTYRELDRRSNRLARSLLARGAGPETFVALALARSIDFVVAVWAVTKTGAAFLPVDPHYPRERIEHMVIDSGAVLGLTVERHLDGLPHSAVWLCLDTFDHAGELDGPSSDPLEYPAKWTGTDASHPAYLVYTSGTTGRPKGVVVTHTGIADFAREQCDRYGVQRTSRTLQFASPSFDASVLELLLAFGAGATMVIAPPELYGGEELSNVLRENRVTHAFVTPAALASADPDGLEQLEVVIVGGDTCSAELVAQWAPGRRMFNAYGPTEATVAVTIGGPLVAGRSPDIGGPIRGVQGLVLDARLHVVPANVLGEFYVSGAGLARGYLNNPALTATRFVANPYGAPGSRLYRTGDQVRARSAADGGVSLHYVGRSDQQVKIRGFRIELGEIDAILASHPAVRSAVSIVSGLGSVGARLISYVVSSVEALDLLDVREYAARHLPSHMVPSAIVSIDEFPLTPAGKLDRAALPEPGAESLATEHRPPVGPLETAVCAAFSRVLGTEEDVFADHSFFELGGNSLLATRAVAAIREEVGVEIPVQWMFTDPTPGAIARRIDSARTEESGLGDESALQVLLPLRAEGGREPLFCVHPAIGLSWCYGGLVEHIDSDRPVYGLQSPTLTEATGPFSSIEELAQRYVVEIRAVQPHGPYHLLGWSIGGLIAHAAAVQLQCAGEEVALLAMMDSYVLADPAMAGARPTLAELLGGLGVEVPQSPSGELTPELAATVLQGAGGPLSFVTPERIETLYQDYLHGSELAHRYEPRVFEGDVLFFSARVDEFDPLRTASAWRPFVTATIVDHFVCATHAELASAESWSLIGPFVDRALDVARTTHERS